MRGRSTFPTLALVACLVAAAPLGVARAGVDGGDADTGAPASGHPPVSDGNADPAVHDVTAFVAPGNATIDDLDDLDRLRARERLVPSRRVALGDTLVLRVRATGLESAVAWGTNDTAGFFDAFDGPDATLRGVETEETVGTMRPPMELLLADPRATTVIPDFADDAYYLVVDTAALRATVQGDDETDWFRSRVTTGDRVGFRVNASLPRSNGTPTTATTTVEFVPPTVRLDANAPPGTDDWRIWLRPAPDQRITGTTTIAPGRNVTVSVEWAGGDARSATVRVAPDRSFAVQLDLAGVPDGTTVEVRVAVGESADGTGPVEARVVEATAAIALRNGTTRAGEANGSVTVERLALAWGGFVVVHRGSRDGPIAGVSAYFPPGQYRNRTLVDPDFPTPGNRTVVAVVYRDRDGDGRLEPATDVPFRANGSVVSARATVRVVPRSGTTTPGDPNGSPTTSPGAGSTTSPGTGSSTTPAATTGRGSPDTGGTDTGETGAGSAGTASREPAATPGFGPLAAASALLAFLVVLRYWRR